VSPQKRKHGFGLLFVATALLAGALGYWAVSRYLGFADAPLAGLQAGDSVQVERGDSFAAVLGKLHAAGVPGGAESRLGPRGGDLGLRRRRGRDRKAVAGHRQEQKSQEHGAAAEHIFRA